MRTIQMATAAVVLALTTVSAAEPVKIVAFGDSLTSGHRLPKGDAYPARLEAALKDEGLDAAVVNHGVSGDTTTGAMKRLQAALDEKPEVFIVALGVNDGLRGVPVPQVRRNLEQIIEAAQKQGAAVVLCGMEALPFNGWQYTIDFHNLYIDLAKKYDVPLVPFIMMGVLGNPDLMSPDGVHPNAAGAKVLAATILPFVRPLVTATETAKVTKATN